MGSHSGYVTDPSDLYLRGNNPAGFTQVQYASFESGGIFHQSTYLPMVFKTSKVYNFTGYTTLAITYYIVSAINRGSLRMTARVYRDNYDYQGESTIGIYANDKIKSTIVCTWNKSNLSDIKQWLMGYGKLGCMGMASKNILKI